jgi:hypothetical protein
MFVLMQLAQTLSDLGLRLRLQWRPRGENQPADDLTNEVFDKFDLAIFFIQEFHDILGSLVIHDVELELDLEPLCR